MGVFSLVKMLYTPEWPTKFNFLNFPLVTHKVPKKILRTFRRTKKIIVWQNEQNYYLGAKKVKSVTLFYIYFTGFFFMSPAFIIALLLIILMENL